MPATAGQGSRIDPIGDSPSKIHCYFPATPLPCNELILSGFPSETKPIPGNQTLLPSSPLPSHAEKNKGFPVDDHH
jgi:hypothetical protein